MKKKMAKTLAVLMCLMTAVAFMPTFAFAAEAEEPAEPVAGQQVEPAEPVTDAEVNAVAAEEQGEPEAVEQEESASAIYVKVTISNKGTLVLKNKTVEVTDINNNGQYDIDDTLYCAHNQNYPGGAAEGYNSYTGEFGLSLGKLWGDGSGDFGYYVNNNSAWSLADTVKAGDSVYAFVYSDNTGWSDKYSYFSENNITAAVEEEITLNLNARGYDADWNVVVGPYANASIKIDDSETDYSTDGDGKVEISFSNAGTYCVSAVGAEGDILVPPVCVVTVYEDDKEIVEKQYQYVVAKKKEECISDLGAIDINAYRAAQQLSVITEIIKGIATINEAKTVTAVEGAFGNVKAAIGTIKTDKQMTAEENAVKAVGISSFSVKAGKKSATVKWAKNSTFSGYQIYYKQAKKSAKNTTAAAASKTIKKLAKGKKVTFKVRGYKVMNGKTVYGKWSASKTVKIK